MISTDILIQQERAVLDSYGKSHSGSEIADFAAKRKRAYLVQEIEKAVRRATDVQHAIDIVRGFHE